MRRAYGIYKKGITTMNKGVDAITITLMLAMVGVVFYQVIMRQFFERPPIWGEEISVTLMVWFVFLGIVLGLEENLHIGITMFVAKLPKKTQFVIEVLVHVLILILAVILIIYGYSLTARMLGFGTALPATGLPAGMHYAVIPLAGIMMVFVQLGKLAGHFIEREDMQA